MTEFFLLESHLSATLLWGLKVNFSVYYTLVQVTQEVNTTYGPIRGFTMPLVANTSVHFAAYVGIPYAKPPVGSLRWKPPEDMNSWGWSAVYNATYFRPCCMQTLDNIQE